MAKKNNNLKKSIMTEVEYGEVVIKLDEILNKRNISTYELSTNSNIRFQTIQNLRDNKSTRIDLNVLAKICYTLGCNVEDIIEYRDLK